MSLEMEAPSDVQMKELTVPNTGTIKLYIQGDLDSKQGKTVFVTVHDLGTNHKGWFPFVMHSSMTEVRLRSIFIHVCLPGQEDNAESLPAEYVFPTFQKIGEDIESILDQLSIKTCIGMGDGAGANIVTRFALKAPNRVMGIILCHCTSTTAGVLEYINNKMIGRKLSTTGMHQGIYDYLAEHKFGSQDKKSEPVQRYVTHLKDTINPQNLAKFFNAFLKRTDITSLLPESLKVEALLVVGSKASNLQTVQAMHSTMNKSVSSLLIVENVGDVVTETPNRLARALILFCKGCGVLSGVRIPGMEMQRTLSLSMEEADQPLNTRSTTGVPSSAAAPQQPTAIVGQ
jgi:pimeloyl-ACP methyl ester carboxylesterase